MNSPAMPASDWMGLSLTTEQRDQYARFVTARGHKASPWERGTCPHGVAYPLRWMWKNATGIASAKTDEAHRFRFYSACASGDEVRS